MFSKTFGYALRAITYVDIHGRDGKKIGIQEIAKQLGIPRHFLAKILQDLVRHGILNSIKGPNGGFYANAHTGDTHLVDILKITDGSLVLKQCILNMEGCNDTNPCPLHNEFARCRNGLVQAMADKTVDSLANAVEDGLAVLAR